MKTKQRNSRRQLLKLGMTATAGVLATGLGCGSEDTSPTSITETAKATSCSSSSQMNIGPFYPHIKNGDGDVDLTRIQGKEGQAVGAVILVRGSIMDEKCQPIEKALVEIWQANHHGRYSHEGDAENPNPLDPHFEGWGEMTTDASGQYGFKTIKPAPYPFGDPDHPENWRTPHIHFKVSRRGYHEVISQMCFAGEELNTTDTVLGELPIAERNQFIIGTEQKEANIPIYQFNLTLKKVPTHSDRMALLDLYAGKYHLTETDKELKQYKVFRKDNQLYLHIEGYTSVELVKSGPHDYKSDALHRRFVFNQDTNGQVDSMTIHNISNYEKATPVVATKII